MKERLDEAGVPMEFYEYEAGHAFTNPTSKNYCPGATHLAMLRLYEFMGKHLT